MPGRIVKTDVSSSGPVAWLATGSRRYWTVAEFVADMVVVQANA